MDIPILGQSAFVVCARGHVNEAPQHQTVSFREDDGTVLHTVLCGRCMFDFHVAVYGGVMLPKTTTRKEAEWKAKAMKSEAEGLTNSDPAPVQQ